MKTKIITIVAGLILLGTHLVKADLIFDTGYNVFDDTSGYYDEVAVISDAHLDVLGGEMGALFFRDSSSGNIFGGEMGWLHSDENAVVNIYRATFDVLSSFPESTVYLYAYDVAYHPDGGLHNGPWMEGKYLYDNSPFSFTFNDDVCVPQLHVVPEPATLFLLVLGSLISRNHLRKTDNFDMIRLALTTHQTSKGGLL